MNLTPDQTRLLDAAAEERAAVERSITDRRAEVEEFARRSRVKVDILAFRLSQAGVPTTRIALDLFGTKNRQTATDAIKRGEISAPDVNDLESLAQVAPAVQKAPAYRFERNADTLSFTTNGDTAEVIWDGEKFDPAADFAASWGPAMNAFFGEDSQYRAAARTYMKENTA